MPSINNISVVDRHNRPPVEARVMLRTYFINDGLFIDPYAVSSVHIFAKGQNLTPYLGGQAVLGEDNLISDHGDSTAKAVFAASAPGIVGGGTTFNEANYTARVVGGMLGPSPCSGVSGIYRLGLGEFACVLDGLIGSSLSGVNHNSELIMNTASGAADYIDIWTVKLVQGGTWKTFINDFSLYDDSFIAITEPVLLRAKNRLFNRNINLGSKVHLKIGTDITIENKNIDEATKNIFREASITNAFIEISKINEDPSLPARVYVVKSSNIEVTSDNTLMYKFDTMNMFDGQPTKFDDLGSRRGTYMLKVHYDLLTEKIYSSPLYFNIK